MAQEFTRNIKNVNEIQKQEVRYSDQNDCASTKDSVYILHQHKWQKMTGQNDDIFTESPSRLFYRSEFNESDLKTDGFLKLNLFQMYMWTYPIDNELPTSANGILFFDEYNTDIMADFLSDAELWTFKVDGRLSRKVPLEKKVKFNGGTILIQLSDYNNTEIYAGVFKKIGSTYERLAVCEIVDGRPNVKTVNGESPDILGNVFMDVGIQTINGVKPDDNGNIDIFNITDYYFPTVAGKPNLNIRYYPIVGQIFNTSFKKVTGTHVFLDCFISYKGTYEYTLHENAESLSNLSGDKTVFNDTVFYNKPIYEVTSGGSDTILTRGCNVSVTIKQKGSKSIEIIVGDFTNINDGSIITPKDSTNTLRLDSLRIQTEFTTYNI